MAYKPRIESNNLDLTSILSTINDLPEAGSGGGGTDGTDLKTCTLTVGGGSTNYYPTDIAYTTVNDSGDVQYAYNSVSGSSITVTCLRNSIVAIKFKSSLNIAGTSSIAPHLLFYNGSLATIKIGDVESMTITNDSGFSGGDV